MKQSVLMKSFMRYAGAVSTIASEINSDPELHSSSLIEYTSIPVRDNFNRNVSTSHLRNTYLDDSYRINPITSKIESSHRGFLVLEDNLKNLLKPESSHGTRMNLSFDTNNFIKTIDGTREDVQLSKECYLERQMDSFKINQIHKHILIHTKHNDTDLDTTTIIRSHFKSFFEKHVKLQTNQYLHNILTRLDDISNRDYDWDGNMSDVINKQSLSRAETIIPEILMTIINRYRWIEPYISSDEEGDITLRWSVNSKRLYIIISEDEIIYLMVSGKDINAKMTEGRIITNSNTEVELEYNRLWKWLISE